MATKLGIRCYQCSFLYITPHYFAIKQAKMVGWLVGYSRMIGHGLGSDATDEFYNFLRVRDNARGSFLRASFDSCPTVL